MYLRDVSVSRALGSRVHRFTTGTRDNVRAVTTGAETAGGSAAQPVSGAENLELLELFFGAGVVTTPTGGTTTRLHTYKPLLAGPPAATLQYQDGANLRQLVGTHANMLTFAGSVDGENLLTADLFGRQLVALGALTGAPTERTPTFHEGWETKLYIDNLAATPGTTAVDGVLINWSIALNGNLGRKYTAANTKAASAVTLGEVDVTATLVFEASAATAGTEYANWDAATGRMLSIRFGGNRILEGALAEQVQIDLPGFWTAVDLGGSAEGTRTYSFSLQGSYDTVLASMVQVRAQCARLAAFA